MNNKEEKEKKFEEFVRRRIWELLMECLPTDAENLALLTDDQKIRLLDKFLKIY
jgi:hypothetical protein